MQSISGFVMMVMVTKRAMGDGGKRDGDGNGKGNGEGGKGIGNGD